MLHEGIAIWGAGTGGIQFYKEHKSELNIVCFYDNDPAKIGTYIYDIPVVEWKKEYEPFIIVASEYWREIYVQLYKEGLAPFRDFLTSEHKKLKSKSIVHCTELLSIIEVCPNIDIWFEYVFEKKWQCCMEIARLGLLRKC